MATAVETFSYVGKAKKKKKKDEKEQEKEADDEEDDELAAERKRREESLRRIDMMNELKKQKKLEKKRQKEEAARRKEEEARQREKALREKEAAEKAEVERQKREAESKRIDEEKRASLAERGPQPDSGGRGRGRGGVRGRGRSRGRGRGRGRPPPSSNKSSAPSGRGSRKVGAVAKQPTMEAIQEELESARNSRQAWSREATKSRESNTKPSTQSKINETIIKEEDKQVTNNDEVIKPVQKSEENDVDEEKKSVSPHRQTSPNQKSTKFTKVGGFMTKLFKGKNKTIEEPKPEPPETPVNDTNQNPGAQEENEIFKEPLPNESVEQMKENQEQSDGGEAPILQAIQEENEDNTDLPKLEVGKGSNEGDAAKEKGQIPDNDKTQTKEDKSEIPTEQKESIDEETAKKKESEIVGADGEEKSTNEGKPSKEENEKSIADADNGDESKDTVTDSVAHTLKTMEIGVQTENETESNNPTEEGPGGDEGKDAMEMKEKESEEEGNVSRASKPYATHSRLAQSRPDDNEVNENQAGLSYEVAYESPSEFERPTNPEPGGKKIPKLDPRPVNPSPPVKDPELPDVGIDDEFHVAKNKRRTGPDYLELQLLANRDIILEARKLRKLRKSGTTALLEMVYEGTKEKPVDLFKQPKRHADFERLLKYLKKEDEKHGDPSKDGETSGDRDAESNDGGLTPSPGLEEETKSGGGVSPGRDRTKSSYGHIPQTENNLKENEVSEEQAGLSYEVAYGSPSDVERPDNPEPGISEDEQDIKASDPSSYADRDLDATPVTGPGDHPGEGAAKSPVATPPGGTEPLSDAKVMEPLGDSSHGMTEGGTESEEKDKPFNEIQNVEQSEAILNTNPQDLSTAEASQLPQFLQQSKLGEATMENDSRNIPFVERDGFESPSKPPGTAADQSNGSTSRTEIRGSLLADVRKASSKNGSLPRSRGPSRKSSSRPAPPSRSSIQERRSPAKTPTNAGQTFETGQDAREGRNASKASGRLSVKSKKGSPTGRISVSSNKGASPNRLVPSPNNGQPNGRSPVISQKSNKSGRLSVISRRSNKSGRLSVASNENKSDSKNNSPLPGQTVKGKEHSSESNMEAEIQGCSNHDNAMKNTDIAGSNESQVSDATRENEGGHEQVVAGTQSATSDKSKNETFAEKSPKGEEDSKGKSKKKFKHWLF